MNNKLQDILQAASLLFASNGVKKTSVDLICHNCGISKKTFYLYFLDKETIVKEIVQGTLVNTEKYIEGLKGLTQDAPAELISFFNFMQDSAPVFTPVFINDIVRFYPEVNNLILESKNKKFLPFFSQNIKKGILEGFYRKSLDANITAALYFRQIDYALEDELVLWEKFKFLSYINSFFLHGILNKRGAAILISSSERQYD